MGKIANLRKQKLASAWHYKDSDETYLGKAMSSRRKKESKVDSSKLWRIFKLEDGGGE